MKRAKILVAVTLIAGSAPLVDAGNQSSAPAQMEVRTRHHKVEMSRQTRSDIRDQVLDSLRETLKQSSRDMHSGCGGMTGH